MTIKMCPIFLVFLDKLIDLNYSEVPNKNGGENNRELEMLQYINIRGGWDIANYIHGRISHIFKKNIRGQFFKTYQFLLSSLKLY